MKFRSCFQILLTICLVQGLFTDLCTGQDGEKKSDSTAKLSPVTVESGIVELSPETTKIEFVGTHVGDDPRPRLGGFEKFKGKITLDGDTVQSIVVDFDITSIWTQIPNLTAHLKTADFFDIKKFPAAKFESTKIATVDGETMVTGNLSMLGNTIEISFPVRPKIGNSRFTLVSEFKLDRTAWGMSKMTDRVESEVSLKVVVGQKTSPQKGEQTGGRRFNVDTFFKTADKDGDGKLTGDEIPARMKDGVERMDTDKDGSISLEELKKAMSRRRGGN